MQLPRPTSTGWFGRYTLGARAYDVLSCERPVYRVGRVDAIDRLGLRPGDRVLDLACGTGLNLPLLRERVGETGQVTGLDASASMLARATARVDAAGWRNVHLVRGDAADLTDLLDDGSAEARDSTYDAVLITYALSIIAPWREVWHQATDLLVPGGRAAVVDLSLPSGRGLLWWPLARFACWTGGSDPHREPWRLAEAELTDVSTTVHRAGHVVVVVGSRP